MADSETLQRITDLGKALIKELSLDSRHILGPWMAYYVATQMQLANVSRGTKKREAEQRCFETVLKLWEYRQSLPDSTRPLKNFEAILRTLDSLDPDNPDPFYYNRSTPRKSKAPKLNSKQRKVQEWMHVAKNLDNAARVLLEYIFHQAALEAKDRKTKSWLENAVQGTTLNDLSIIVEIIGEKKSHKDPHTEGLEHRKRQEQLKSRINQLDDFIAASKKLRQSLVELSKAAA